MKYLSIKNYERYQHYKDRSPPWIKLHVSLLDDYDFRQLADASKAHLMLLWALASKTENRIPYDLVFISQMIGASSPVDIEELILRGFLEPYDEKRAMGRREEWASRYVSAQTRADLLSAAQHRCTVCPATSHLEIDHILPISQGGTGDRANLQVLCRQCNRRKRARLAEGSAPPLRSKSLRQARGSALLETETETEERQRKRTTSADAEKVKENWVSEGSDVWSELVAPIEPGRFGRALKVMVRKYGWPDTRLALLFYIEETEGKPRRVEWFVADAVRCVRLGKMGMMDDSGGLTERGELARRSIARLA